MAVGGTAAPDEPPVLTVGFAVGTPRGPEHTQFQWKSSAGFPSVGQMERILVALLCSEWHEHVGKILGLVLKQGKQAVTKP